MSQLALLVDGVVSQLFSLDDGIITIGRSPDSNIWIDDASVSMHHATITAAPSDLLEGHHEIFIEDLNSRNGTFVNDVAISRTRLQPDDIVTVGWNKFKLLDDHTVGRETTVLMMLD